MSKIADTKNNSIDSGNEVPTDEPTNARARLIALTSVYLQQLVLSAVNDEPDHLFERIYRYVEALVDEVEKGEDKSPVELVRFGLSLNELSQEMTSK